MFAALAIIVVLSLIVIFTERGKVGEDVLAYALQSANHFNTQASHILNQPGLPDHDGIKNELEAFAARSIRMKAGHFVYIIVYDAEGNEIVKQSDANYAELNAVKSFIQESGHGLTPGNNNDYEVVRLQGRPHIKVKVPLRNIEGNIVAYADGVFAVSDEAITAVAWRVMRTVLAVVVIVLITTALLYPVILGLMRRLTKLSLNLLDSNLETLKVLGSAIAKRDSDTDAHNYRVTIMAVRLAEAVGLNANSIQSLIKGAFLHDVGKIGIPDYILLKEGKLTEEEFEVMRNHVQHGLDIIIRSDWLSDAADVVASHHEKYDGSGYPAGISADNKPLNARIFAIADVFDALTSQRPYKQPFSYDDTMQILSEGRGSHFDPALIDKFFTIAPRCYEEVANRDDEGLKHELEAITNRYFTNNINSML